LREKQDWHEELRAQLDAEQKQISTTDADARRMRAAAGQRGGLQRASSVDAKHKLIAAADVTNEETDVQQLANVARQAKENLAVDQLEWWPTRLLQQQRVSVCEQQHITATFPSPTPAPTLDKDIRQAPVHLRRNQRCLRLSGGPGTDAPFQHRRERAAVALLPARDCRSCALKKQCTRNQGNRTITREEDEAVMEAMARESKRSRRR